MNELNSDEKVVLRRSLSLWDAVWIGVGAIIGGGIFTLTGLAAGSAGTALPLVMLLNGIIAFLTVLAYAELGSAFPEAGGGYIWIRKGLGPLSGHMAGWISWFAHSVASGVYALSLGFYLTFLLFDYLFPILHISAWDDHWFWQKFTAVVTIILLSWVNYRGVSGAGKLGKYIVILEIAIILIFVAFGLAAFFITPDVEGVKNLGELLPHGVGGLLAGMGILYLAFQGSEIVVQSSEELQNPKKNLAKAIFISFAIVIAIYMLVSIVAIIGVKGPEPSWQVLAKAGEGALVDAVKFFPLNAALVPLMLVGGLLAAFAALNATIFSASHVFYALSRGKSFPEQLARLHEKHHTPHIGIAASALLIIFMSVLLPLKDIAAVADLLFILMFLQVHMALIEMRKRYPDQERPFRVPLHPLPSLLAIASYSVLITQLLHLSPWGVTITILWIFAGFILYVMYAKPREIEQMETGFVGGRKERFTEPQKENDETAESENKSSPEQKPSYRILLPLRSFTNWQEIIPYAIAIAKAYGGEITVVNLMEFPPSVPMLIDDHRRESAEKLVHSIADVLAQEKVDYEVFSEKTRDPIKTVLDVVASKNTDLLFVPWDNFLFFRKGFGGEGFDTVLRETRCDLLVFKTARFSTPSGILVPIANSPHNEILGRIASSFVDYFSSGITALHIQDENDNRPISEEEFEKIIEKLSLPQNSSVTRRLNIKGSMVQTIVEESGAADLIVMGAAPSKTLGTIQFGKTASEVMAKSEKTVLVCYHHKELTDPMISPIRAIIRKIADKLLKTIPQTNR